MGLWRAPLCIPCFEVPPPVSKVPAHFKFERCFPAAATVISKIRAIEHALLHIAWHPTLDGSLCAGART